MDRIMAHPDFPEVKLVSIDVHKDERGDFFESYRANWHLGSFIQDNVSYSKGNVVRGLHYQIGRPQAKLVKVIAGHIYDVVVDIRRSSPTFGKHAIIALWKDGPALFVPEGFAHGFATLLPAIVHYKCSDERVPELSRGILWNDPALHINWPVSEEHAVLSDKDKSNPPLKEAELPK